MYFKKYFTVSMKEMLKTRKEEIKVSVTFTERQHS